MADGQGCTCNAYYSGECACDADWTPQEEIDLRKKNKLLIRALENILEQNKEKKNLFGRALAMRTLDKVKL